MDEPNAAKRPSVLTIDRAAFLLLRVKRAFKKKRQQRKDKHTNNTSKPANSRRTHDLVDEAFLEQKDILLDMLETKLKEVRDKKKKKNVDKTDSNTTTVESKCDSMLHKTGELKLSATGISAIGEVDTHLRFGESGKGTLKLNAVGISNVGRSHLDLGVEDGNIHVPGLSNLFTGNVFSSNCDKQVKKELEKELNNPTVTPIARKRSKPNIDGALSDVIANATEADAKQTSGDINVPPTINRVKNVNESPKSEAVKANVTVPHDTVNAVL